MSSGHPTGPDPVWEHRTAQAEAETMTEHNTKPEPLKLDAPSEPKMFVQKVGWRWKSWVEVGFMVCQGEFGTYSWTRARAEKKARKLFAYATARPNPVIEVLL